LIVLASVGLLSVLAFALLGDLRLTRSFDVEGVRQVSVGEGTLTYIQSDEPELTVTAPLKFWPNLMVRRTGELLELGGADDADIRGLFYWLPPFSAFATASGASVEWKLALPEVDDLAPEFRGKVVVDGYAGRRLVVGGSADAELRNLDVDELILWSQPGGEISAAGRATTLSQMDNEGTIVTDGLDYRYLDRSLVEELMAE